MTRHLTKVLAGIALLTLVTAGAWAQGQGVGRGQRWANLDQAQVQKIIDLHQKIGKAQWELWTLKATGGDKKKIEQKTKAVNELRYQLARLKTQLPPGPCFQNGQQGPQQRGWCRGKQAQGMHGGQGMCGRGMRGHHGRGFGRQSRGHGYRGQCPLGNQPPTPTPAK